MTNETLEERIKQFENFRCSYGCDELQNGAQIIRELQAENEKLKTSNFVSNFLSNRIQIKKDDLAGMNQALEGYIEKIEAENKELKEKLKRDNLIPIEGLPEIGKEYMPVVESKYKVLEIGVDWIKMETNEGIKYHIPTHDFWKFYQSKASKKLPEIGAQYKNKYGDILTVKAISIKLENTNAYFYEYYSPEQLETLEEQPAKE